MAHVSGNPTWVDWPNTSTQATAATYEAIEGQLDRQPDDTGIFERRVTAAQAIAATTNTYLVFGGSTSTTGHVTSTSTSVFTVNTSAVYILEAGVVTSTATTSSMVLWVGAPNDSVRYVTTGGQTSATAAYPGSNVCRPVYLAAGTQLSVGIFCSAALTVAAGATSHFTATLLRRS